MKIEKSNWFITENSLSISLMDYYVKIEAIFLDKVMYWQVKMIDSNMFEKLYYFNNLEEAVLFIEEGKYKNKVK